MFRYIPLFCLILLVILLFVVNRKEIFLDLGDYDDDNNEGFMSADFSRNFPPNSCRCKNGSLGSIAHYINAGTCVCDKSYKNRDRPELTPGCLGREYREMNPFHKVKCMQNKDLLVNLKNKHSETLDNNSSHLRFQTFKKIQVAPCNSILTNSKTFENQYKRYIMSQKIKNLRNKPYMFTENLDDRYFSNFVKV